MPSPINCPRCQSPTEIVHAAGIELDACRGCEGLWFDKDELSRTLKSTDAVRDKAIAASWSGSGVRDPDPSASEMTCPRCGGGMRRYRFGLSSTVLIDGCLKGCGVWLDDGELGSIAEHLSEHLRPTTPTETATLGAHHATFQAAADARNELVADRLRGFPKLADDVIRLIRAACQAIVAPESR